MANQEQPPGSVQLPEDLREQFARLEARLWRVETLDALGIALGGLALSASVLFFSDRFWETPPLARCAITAAGAVAASVAAVRWSRRWIWRRRDRRALASLVQKRFRRLGDRLLGIVELADESKRPPGFSPALYRAAIEQVAAEARAFQFADAVRTKEPRRRMAAAGAVFASAALVFLIFPEAGRNALARWAAPLGGTPRYTLVAIEALPPEKNVPHGEAFTVNARVLYRSFWRPGKAAGRFEKRSWIESAVQDGSITFNVPGETREGTFQVRIGDTSAILKIRPSHRPSLKQLTAAIHLPDYLQYPVVTQKVESATLPLLEGSEASFIGTATRPLASARIQSGENPPAPLPVEGSTFQSQAEKPAGNLSFDWEDTLGLRGASPWKLAIEPVQDAPPTVDLREAPREMSMLETEVLTLKARARDDYGVRELGLLWAPEGDWGKTNAAPRAGFKTEAAKPTETELTEDFGFSPMLLKVPADSFVEVKLYAKDSLPGREAAESVPYRIRVLGNEKHAEMIRQQLESLQARLEEITRLEEKVAAGTKELSELAAKDLQAEKQNEKLASLAEDQAQTAANLEQLAREGGDSLREAMRNPLIPEETLKDWTKNLQQMRELSKNQMQQAAKSLQSARKNPASREKDVAEAKKQQEEALESLERMQSKVNKELDQLQALTLAGRLRKLSGEEKEIETGIQKGIGETIGLLPSELPANFQKANRSLANQQAEAHQEIQTLNAELSRFFERTQKPEYGEVHKEITEARAPDEIDKIKALIQDNISMEAMQNLARWSDRFAAWAEKLEPKSKGGEGGEGSGEGGKNDMAERLMRSLLGLLRLREGEVNLREQTRLLDQAKEESPVYLFNADRLAEKEKGALHDLFRIQKDTPIASLQIVYADIFVDMKAVEGLLQKPETGQSTRVAETKTIEAISDAINLINEQARQNSGQSQKASQSMEEMAFLMQMMAQQPSKQIGADKGKSGGGSQAGGSTDRRPDAAAGNMSGKAGEGREVQKATGFSGDLPVEFRDALEQYFNAIEKEGE